MNTAVRKVGLTLVSLTAAGAIAATAAPAQAQDHGDRVEARGSCAGGGGTWKLTAKHDDGKIEYEFEVDTNQVGKAWTVKVSDNGTRVFSGHRTTKAPSGSFSLEKKIANRSGTDVIKAKATRGDRTCVGTVSV